MRFMKKRKDIEMCNKLKLITIINGISMEFVQMTIFLLGILFINNKIHAIDKCISAENFIILEYQYCQ